MSDDQRDLVRWYLKRAQLADHLILSERERACPEPIQDVEAERFADAAQARAWVARNRRNLMALVELAASESWHFEAWALAEAMWVYFRTSTLHQDAERCYRLAVAEATADGNAEAETIMKLLLTRVRTAGGAGTTNTVSANYSQLAGGVAKRRAAPRISKAEGTRQSNSIPYEGAVALAPSNGAVDHDRRAELYLAARNGDKPAQRVLVEEHNELLWRVARRAGLDRESASDAVQTAWLRLWSGGNRLEQPHALTKWLITTVRREAWKLIGGARRELTTDPIDIQEQVIEGIEEGLVRDSEHEAVRRAFLAQPERCRRLLAYVAAVDRPDYDDIAEALGMKRGSIGPTRGRCLNRLRKTLLADPGWGGTEAEPDGSPLSEDDPLDTSDARVISTVDELHERDDPFPED